MLRGTNSARRQSEQDTSQSLVEHGDITDEERRRFWRGKGCPSCYGKPIGKQPFRGQLTTALHEVLGDNLDGLASELVVPRDSSEDEEVEDVNQLRSNILNLVGELKKRR